MTDSASPDRKAVILVLLLIAGCVDAVGLAELGSAFVSFMSGNTTTAALRIGYHDWPGALLPLGLIALFVGGAAAGTLIAEGAGARWTGALLLTEAVLLVIAWAGFDSPRPLAGIVALPIAMGLATIVAPRAPAPHLGTSYVTGTLVRIGVGLAGLGRGTDPRALLFDVAMWAALFGGAVAGTVGRLRFGTDLLLAPAAVLAVLAAAELAATSRR